jgi:hypothetical protein
VHPPDEHGALIDRSLGKLTKCPLSNQYQFVNGMDIVANGGIMKVAEDKPEPATERND